jgi:hypothetical protein
VAERAHAKGSVAEPEVPADVSDRKVRRLMQDLDPWLRLAARVGFGAGSRLDPSGRSPLAASGLRARSRRLRLSR